MTLPWRCHGILVTCYSNPNRSSLEAILRNEGANFVQSHLYTIQAKVPVQVKPQSHYSDNQSPTSDNHFFLGGCRRLSSTKDDNLPQAPKKKSGCQRSATGCRYSVTVALNTVKWVPYRACGTQQEATTCCLSEWSRICSEYDWSR